MVKVIVCTAQRGQSEAPDLKWDHWLNDPVVIDGV